MYDLELSMTNDEDFDLTFQVVDENDEPRDISSWTIEFVLNDPDGAQIVSKTSADPEITTEPETGTISIVLTGLKLSGHDTGTYPVGCRSRDNVTGFVKQLFVGDLAVTEGHFQ
jgi:hypothetical protein